MSYQIPGCLKDNRQAHTKQITLLQYPHTHHVLNYIIPANADRALQALSIEDWMHKVLSNKGTAFVYNAKNDQSCNLNPNESETKT